MADPGTDWSNPVVPTADPSAAGQFPTSGSSNTDDSILGVSNALGQIPIMVQRRTSLSMDPEGGVPTSVAPLESVLDTIYQMSPAQRAQLQSQMMQANLYPNAYYGKNPPTVVPGEIDAGTFAAWKTLVEETARSSTYSKKNPKNAQEVPHLVNAKTVSEVLQERLDAQKAAGTAGPGRNPAQLTPATDLEAYLHNAAQTVLGFAPSPSDLTNYVFAQHEKETEAAQQDPTTGNVTAAPSPQAFAEQWLRDRYPVEAGVNKTLNYGNEIVNRLAANAGGTLPMNSAVTSGG